MTEEKEIKTEKRRHVSISLLPSTIAKLHTLKKASKWFNLSARVEALLHQTPLDKKVRWKVEELVE